MRLGVLDVGSNTVHFLVVDAYHGAAPIPAHSAKTELRLAEHTDADNAIEAGAVDELIRFISTSLSDAEDLGVTDVVAFATSAIRQASNGEAVIERVRGATGIDLQVLSGVDEGRLTFLAVRRWYGWSSGQLLVLDIGGGSLEIAIGDGEEPAVSISLPLGAGRLTRGRFTADPPTADEVKALRKEVRAAVADVAGRITREGAPRLAVGTSKTFRQLARIAGAAPSSEGPYAHRSLTHGDLVTWLPKLASMTSSQRVSLPGVSIGRAPQLVAGAIVADAAMDLLGVSVLQIAPWALREGIILRRLDALRDNMSDETP